MFILFLKNNEIKRKKSNKDEIFNICKKEKYNLVSWFCSENEAINYIKTELKRKTKYLITLGYKRADEYEVHFRK